MHRLVNVQHALLQLVQHVLDHRLREVPPLLVTQGALLRAGHPALECLQAAFVVLIERLQVLDLLLVLLSQPDDLVEEHSALFLLFDPVEVVVIQLLLEKGTHLSQLLVTLRLQRLDEVGELTVLLLSHSQLVTHFQTHLLFPVQGGFEG